MGLLLITLGIIVLGIYVIKKLIHIALNSAEYQDLKSILTGKPSEVNHEAAEVAVTNGLPGDLAYKPIPDRYNKPYAPGSEEESSMMHLQSSEEEEAGVVIPLNVEGLRSAVIMSEILERKF